MFISLISFISLQIFSVFVFRLMLIMIVDLKSDNVNADFSICWMILTK